MLNMVEVFLLEIDGRNRRSEHHTASSKGRVNKGKQKNRRPESLRRLQLLDELGRIDAELPRMAVVMDLLLSANGKQR
jgi:hypothetical protein